MKRTTLTHPCRRQMVFIYSIAAALAALPSTARSQPTIVSGQVTDKHSGEPLNFVTITFHARLRGTLTDEQGKFSLRSNEEARSLTFSVVGYQTLTIPLLPGQQQVVHVALERAAEGLGEVVVTPGKGAKYRNRNNPAVELIRQVIAHKGQNRMESHAFTSYRQYERMVLSLAHLSDSFRQKKFFRDYQFLFKTQDTDAIGGTLLLPLYMEEKTSSNYFRKAPAARKQIVEGFKQVKYSEDFIDNKGVSTWLNFLYQDIDIYDNNILLLTNQMLSPIANSGPLFYEYYISDTLKDVSPQLVKLTFRARNPNDLLFQGTLYITLDGRYAVKEAVLRTNRHINLNFVRQMEGRLYFEQAADGRFMLLHSDLKIDFGLTRGKGSGMFGERLVNRDSLQVDVPLDDQRFKGPPVEVRSAAEERDTSFWSRHRSDTADVAASQIYRNLDSLQTIPSYKRKMTIASVLLSGYKSFGKFEIGPLNSFYSFNPVEGARPRFGGRTTAALSQRYYFEGYGAYGTLDRQFKYFASATYSLNNKSIYTFPQQYVRASFQHDTKIPGLDLAFVQENNFLLSFKRGDNMQWTYNNIFRLDYVYELPNHFSYTFGYKYWQQFPAGSIVFNAHPGGDTVSTPSISTSEFSVGLRYAPQEKFYQGKLYRTPIIDQYPVINLRYSQGVRGLFGGQYNYQDLTLNVFKRFYVAPFGYTNVTVEGGYIFGQVPFPLLTIHRANQTYSLQLQAYNLMNFMEFVSDHYAALNVEHNFNGAFFNKIPLLKQLRWREIISAKALWGGLRSENNPALHPDLLQFPVNAQGQPTTFTLNGGPYVEVSVGIGNIFRLIRVDLVRRLTYLQNPQVSPIGIRTLIKFDF